MDKAQIICLVTFCVYLVALLFFLCGFGGPNWLEDDESHWIGKYNIGLWQACLDNGYDKECDDIELDDQDDWFKATAAMMILGLFAAIASGATFLWLPICAVCHCVTGGFTLLAIIIWGSKYGDLEDLSAISLKLGWSFALATLSAIMFLANGGVMAFLALASGCDMTRRALPCISGGPT